MKMQFSMELFNSVAGQPATYIALNIYRDAHNSIRFDVVGVNDHVVAVGQCEPEELLKLAEMLGEPREE